MQKTTIEWTEFVSNPIKGKCLHNCSYCYAEKIRLRFKQPAEYSWHPEELRKIEQHKKPTTIFMGSMYDLFGEWVPESHIDRIIATTRYCQQHTFLFLTKNPERYEQFIFPRNCFLGATATDQESYIRAFNVLCDWPRKNKVWISMEPLINIIDPHLLIWIDGIVIGAMTGQTKVIPRKSWIDHIIKKAEDMPIFIKDNLLNLYADLPKRREVIWKGNIK